MFAKVGQIKFLQLVTTSYKPITFQMKKGKAVDKFKKNNFFNMIYTIMEIYKK